MKLYLFKVGHIKDDCDTKLIFERPVDGIMHVGIQDWRLLANT